MNKKSRKKKKSPVRRTKKKIKTKRSPVVMRIFSFLILAGLLAFSMAVAAYVIFFRTAVAHGAQMEVEEEGAVDIAFEEPYTSPTELPSDILPIRDSSLPMVAIIIDDMGYHKDVGTKLLALPLNLTFSFLAAAPFTKELEETAFQAGRIILLHQPMEPKSSEWDPGPGALLTGQNIKEQADLFLENIQAVPHAVGVNNHMGSLYTENRKAMDSFMQLLIGQGLFFVDSFTTSDSQGLKAARAAGVLSARRHIFLDNLHSTDEICKQLQKLVEHAERTGWGIGIGHPNAETLDALTHCQESLLKRVRLVGVQELLLSLEGLMK